MRALLTCLLLVISGCWDTRAESTKAVGGEADNDGAPDPASPGELHGCNRDDQCVLAAATCCECPSFAIRADDPANDACSGGSCEPSCPTNVQAVCNSGSCELACKPLGCGETCADGFMIDATGCLSCACAVPPDDGCTDHSQCVRTRADCCGCEHGGADTAVLASELAAHEAELGCSDTPQCPFSEGTCEAAEPRCIQGRCELWSAT